MKNRDNIEQLFKETFDRFEADVNPQVWANVQTGIKSVSGSIGSAATKFAVGKIVAGITSVALIAGSVLYFSSTDEKTTPASATHNKTEINSKETSQNAISVNPSSDNVFKTNTSSSAGSSIHYSNKDLSSTSQQTRIPAELGSNVNSTDVPSVSENETNTAKPSERHKYGNSSDEPTSLIRGNHAQENKSKSSKENSNSNNEEETQAPTVNIFASTESGDVPLTVNFSNQGIADALAWDFGDGSVSRELSPSYTFNKPGHYLVKLSSKNAAGSASDKVMIEVKPVSGITTTPNIFSPNGDGENDLFFFGLKNIASIEVTISDINGVLINKWNTTDGNWNGKLMNGEYAPEGLYFYAIQAIGTDGIPHHQKGSVTLSRKR